MKRTFAFTFLITVAFANTIIPIEEDPQSIKLGNYPADWVKVSDSASGEIKLTFALTQNNINELEKVFWTISNPSSISFRKFLTFEEVTALVAPTAQQIKVVVEWLAEYGITKYELTPSKDFLIVSTTIETAEKLLHSKYATFQHKTLGTKIVKAMGSYSLPEHVAERIDFVSGFRFPNLKSKFKKGPIMSAELQRKALVKSGKLQEKFTSSNNGPLMVYINPLDEFAAITFLPFCYDGSVPTSNQSPTTSLCDAKPIKTIEVSANSSRNPTQRFELEMKDLHCTPCNKATGHVSSGCTQANVLYGYPANAVYCEAFLQPLRNWDPLTFTMQTYYQDNSASDLRLEDIKVALGDYVTPQKIWDLYKIPPGTMTRNPSTTMSVAEFLDQYYSPSDLSMFFKLMGLEDRSNLVSVIGPNDITKPGGEATLDIEYIMGVAQNVPTVFWSLGGTTNGQEPFLEWITAVLNSQNPPLIHSISYGDDENTLSTDFMSRCNAEFMKAGVRGISLFFSSGDNGVFGGESFTCTKFTPSFPASSPYVTAVGGTLLSKQTTPICDQELFGLKIPCHTVGEVTSSTSLGSRISSGGGFSAVFPRPSYQADVVSKYITKSISDIPSSYYASSGRAYPDISALAHNFLVVLGGSVTPIDGTSAAAPTAAGVFALLTDVNLNIRNPPLGFLNPWLYSIAKSNATAFNDIVMGDNRCSEIPIICCSYGLPAAVGWDAVTGLGSPNYNVLADILRGV